LESPWGWWMFWKNMYKATKLDIAKSRLVFKSKVPKKMFHSDIVGDLSHILIYLLRIKKNCMAFLRNWPIVWVFWDFLKKFTVFERLWQAWAILRYLVAMIYLDMKI
jgi:hypothetical protein